MSSKKLSSVFLILLLVSSVIILGNSRTALALTPVADLTGEWSGFAQIANTEKTCEFTGKINAQLTQNGNDIKGKYSFVQTGAKSSNPDVYYCDLGSFEQTLHGTLDGSRITLYSEDSTFSGWYASSGINLDISSDGITGKVQLSPTNFTPPSYTPKNVGDDAKKKAADDAKKKAADDAKKKEEEAKKMKAAEEAKKKAADEKKKSEEAKKKAAEAEKKKKAADDEKKKAEEAKKMKPVDEKKTEAVKDTKKKTEVWIDVRARHIKGLSALPVWHLFILYHDANDLTYFYRGGPSSSSAPFGTIIGTSGLYKPDTVDYTVDAPSKEVMIGSDAEGKNTCFQKELVRITSSKITYQAQGPNSNSVVYTLLVNCKVPTEKPVTLAPGWGTILK